MRGDVPAQLRLLKSSAEDEDPFGAGCCALRGCDLTFALCRPREEQLLLSKAGEVPK